MAYPGSRAESGVFIRPIWRRAPGPGERAGAVMLTLLILTGIAVLPFTLTVGSVRTRLDPQRIRKDVEDLRRHLPLSASAPATAGGAKVDGTKAEEPGGGDQQSATAPQPGPKMDERYRQGRDILTGWLAGVQESIRSSASLSAVAVISAGVALAAVILVFFGWRLRRLTAALGGALAFGGAAALVARGHFGLGWGAATVVALPPAFCGALIGWHLMVLAACLQAGAIAALAAVQIAVLCGLPQGRGWAIGCYLVAGGLATAGAYLFAARAMLISGWSVWGAVLLVLTGILGVSCLGPVLLPWEAFLAIVGVLALLGTLVQYRFAQRAAEEPPEPVAQVA